MSAWPWLVNLSTRLTELLGADEPDDVPAALFARLGVAPDPTAIAGIELAVAAVGWPRTTLGDLAVELGEYGPNANAGYPWLRLS
jgi:hypothetical protein